MFGGLDERGKPSDELYWIKLDLGFNMRCVSGMTGEYKNSMIPEIRL